MFVVQLVLGAIALLVVAALVRHFARTFGADVPDQVRALLHARGLDLSASPAYADVEGVPMKWLTATASTPKGEVRSTVVYARRPGVVFRDAVVFREGAVTPVLEGLREVPLASGAFRDAPIRAYAADPPELGSWLEGALELLRRPDVVAVRADEGALRAMAIPPAPDVERADALLREVRAFAAPSAPALTPIERKALRGPANGFRVAVVSVVVAAALALAGALLLPATTRVFDRVVCPDGGEPAWFERVSSNHVHGGTVGGWGCPTPHGLADGNGFTLGLVLFDPLLLLGVAVLFGVRPRFVRSE